MASGTRRTVGLVVLALLIAVFAAMAWRTRGLIEDNRRLNPVTAPGPPTTGGYRFIAVHPETGRPARYNPCESLHYVVNLNGAPASALQDIQESVRLTAEVSGIEFVFDGETSEVPARTRPSYLPDAYGERWSPVLIGWVPNDPNVFEQHDVAVAGSAPVLNTSGELVYVSGTMILNADKQLSSGFDAGRTWGKVILHEWGHLLGLDHVEDTTQVMNGSLVSSPARWGVGDSAGLRAVGREAGCLEPPELP